ncbi:response regulator transcription factor [Pseudoalteromonas sp. JBTF-M23]|uniref:Response regulator transcription factor n=1 Tax=Pseudoalteromonas caenipelagi TaxID=2726988 RepID=A0A849VG15_9GAMM|nr:response regulator transcription factor [Pseudoalteromonas caenipelagi]NOU51453.1 response regulator transcription factor [Pseudoalteromonas caenipelagi]
MTKLALVEDDLELAQWICDYLSAKQYKVDVYHDGQQALDALKTSDVELVVLDGMLPSLDGLEVCKQLRQHSNVPILMLTARDEEIDEILGLEMGADDYLTKPVRGRLLETRIKALLRRNQVIDRQSNSSLIELGSLVLNKATREVCLADEPINLSSNEFDALWLLACKSGQVVGREELTQALCGFEYDGFDRSIDLRISRLRKKLGDNGSMPFKIKTIWGKGYLLVSEVW